MEAPYQDDMRAGFSDDERDFCVSDEEATSNEELSLLDAMLSDGGGGERRGREEGERGGGGDGGSQRGRRGGGGGKGSKASLSKSGSSAQCSGQTDFPGRGTGIEREDEMAQMKAQMLTMQEELQKLRKQVEIKEPKAPLPHSHSSVPAFPQPATRVSPAGSDGRGQHRVAHQPGPTVSPALGGSTPETGGVATESAPTSTRDRNVAADIIRQRRQDEEKNCITEKFSGLRVKNPLISSELMGQRMQGRKMIRVAHIAGQVKGDDIEGDWVTIGVIVSKVPPKESARGHRYAVFRLSDLSSQKAVISLFLYGKACQELWKTPVGYVVAILNPSILPAKESYSLAVSVEQPQRLMLLGVSQDFTTCRANTKAGSKCTNFASNADGGYCDYHTRGAYTKMRSQRMEFQSGYGPASGNLLGKLFKDSKTSYFHYGGQTFAPPPSKKSSSRGGGGGGGGGGGSGMDGRGSVQPWLFASGEPQEGSKCIAQEMKVASGAQCPLSGSDTRTQDGSETFKQLLSTQSAGARMLNKHLVKEEALKNAAGIQPEKSASEFLKSHRTQTTPSSGKKSAEKKVGVAELFAPDCKLNGSGQSQACPVKVRKEVAGRTAGGRGRGALSERPGNLPLRETSSACVGSKGAQKSGAGMAGSPPTARSEVTVHCDRVSGCRSPGTLSDEEYSEQPHLRAPALRLAEQQSRKRQRKEEGGRGEGSRGEKGGRVGGVLLSPPLLGRGFSPGSELDLDSPSPSSSRASLAKLKAIATLKSKGSRGRCGPVMPGGRAPPAARKEAILQRVGRNLGEEDHLGETGVADWGGHCGPIDKSGEREGKVQLAKKQKLDHAALERVMNAKSSHAWAVQEEEWEREQEYFDGLEKKERLEEKLCSIMELRVAVVQCSQCDYVAEHMGDVCRKENHKLARYKVTKRSFECVACKDRSCTYNTRQQTASCRKCGGSSFKQCSLYRERKGPKLPTEQLLLRGEEEKFLNSLK